MPASVRKIRGLDGARRRAKVISFDEMWTYVGARRGKKRRSVWIWTAVVEEKDGERWADFEVGSRERETFVRLLSRLPEAERYRSDSYEAYGWLPTGSHVVGKGSEVNRNEGLHSVLRGKLNGLGRRVKGYLQERGDAGRIVGDGVAQGRLDIMPTRSINAIAPILSRRDYLPRLLSGYAVACQRYSRRRIRRIAPN